MDMTPGTQRKIQVMQAFARGEKIERRRKFEKTWEDSLCPCWDWTTYFYRVKPGGEIPKQTLIDSLNAALHGSYLSKTYIRAILKVLETPE